MSHTLSSSPRYYFRESIWPFCECWLNTDYSRRIIGVQSFKGSLRRNCYIQPMFGENQIQTSQYCGGHINATTLDVSPSPYIQLDGTPAVSAKGYTCPLGQVCQVCCLTFFLNCYDLINLLEQEGSNPNGGVESFDNIYYAALQVVVVTSANTVCFLLLLLSLVIQFDIGLISSQWSSIMYSIIDAEFFVSCFFFIICILVLNFWLINLFVAVITHTFSAIRDDTQKSAFGAAPCVSCPLHTRVKLTTFPFAQTRTRRRRAPRGLGERETCFSELDEGVLLLHALVLGVSGSCVTCRTSHCQCWNE